MSAPIKFHSVTDSGCLRVLVGKSPELRLVVLTRRDKFRLLSELTATLERIEVER